MFFDGLLPDIEIYDAENGRFGVLLLREDDDGEIEPELHACLSVGELVELIKIECSSHLISGTDDETADKEV